MVDAFSEGPIYATYIHLPRVDSPIPSHITNNLKFYPFFKDAVGAINVHILHVCCQ
ncbi:hypothetical protein BKA83DRAFT_4056830 [Pisolithus microcarpus]|nr:hypothetical protein BKA83DRAFT_4056830 [Pisolithus microcarpus]